MYPSIKAKLIRKAVSQFSQGLNDEENDVIEAALEMQKFSMANTLIQFREKYYEYGEGGEDVEGTTQRGWPTWSLATS